MPGGVSTITQDADGYLWLGTDRGLIRFDGVRFLPYPKTGTVPLPQAPVSALWSSRDGTLWVGFRDQLGVRRIVRGEVFDTPRADGLPMSSVSGLVADRANTMWAASGSGLFRLREKTWQPVDTRSGFPATSVTNLAVSRAGTLYAATPDGAFKLLEGSQHFEPIDGSELAVDVNDDSAGRSVFTDPIVGFRVVGESVSDHRKRESAIGFRLLSDSHGAIWLGTWGQGLWRVPHSPRTGKDPIEKVTVLSGLSSNGIRTLFEDREGNIWAGTFDGLDRLSPNLVEPFLNIGVVRALDATPSGDTWVGTTRELIRFSTRSELQTGVPNRRFDVGPVTALTIDGAAVWVLTSTGLVKINGDRTTRVPLPPTHNLTRIVAMKADRQGGLWFVGRESGLLHWRNNWLEAVDVGPELAPANITTLYVDRRGHLWFGTDSSRVGRINSEGTVQLYGVEHGIGPGPYNVFGEDADGVLWIGGRDGVSWLDAERFGSVGRQDGFPAAIVSSIVEDTEGALWFGTSAGIVRIAKSEFKKVTDSPGHQLRFRLYDKSDGTAGAPIRLGGPGAVRLRDGTLCFVTGRGLTSVDPRLLSDAALPAAVRIDGVTADGEWLDAASRRFLPAGTRRLQIQYSLRSLRATGKTRFRYRLEGFDAEWIDAGAAREALYTNLGPGGYRFRVVADNAEGYWHEPGTEWMFTVAPFFYQTWTSLVLCALTFCGALWGGWQLHIRRLRREFNLIVAERVRLSHELHDTLLQDLVGLTLQVEGTSRALSSSPADWQSHLARFRKQVEHYVREARESIWNLHSPASTNVRLPEALREYGRRAAEGHGVNVDLQLSGVPSQTPCEIEDQVLRIGQEAILNAARHARAKNIHVQLRYGYRVLELTVSDDGEGFPSGDLPHANEPHFGLTVMNERARRIGGHVGIASNEKGGVVVSAVIPLPDTETD